jgi:hypothetical protein
MAQGSTGNTHDNSVQLPNSLMLSYFSVSDDDSNVADRFQRYVDVVVKVGS